jgi:ABC-2 type transport system ATP-binding protein
VLLELDRLNKYYGPIHALRDVTVAVRPGCVGLLGPNGAGKSTLLRTVLGLLEHQGGGIKVLGRLVSAELLTIRQRVGFMPEQETYFPAMTGLDMVAYAGQLAGLYREDAVARAHEMLDYAGVGEARYREVEGYSTGMKQRAKLAQALVHGPELVFLDEPTNGLDPIGREEMLAMIAELSASGVNVVLSSHLLRDVERVCDSVVLMNAGRVVHYTELETFKRGAVEQVEVEVRGGSGRDAFLAGVAELGLRAEVPEGAERFVVTVDGQGDVDALWRLAAGQGCEVRHLKPVTVSLEAAFMQFIAGLGENGARLGASLVTEGGGGEAR